MSPIETPLNFDIHKPSAPALSLPTEPMFTSSLPIRPAKLKYLLKLSEKYIPTEFQVFYQSLHAGEQPDSDCEDD